MYGHANSYSTGTSKTYQLEDLLPLPPTDDELSSYKDHKANPHPTTYLERHSKHRNRRKLPNLLTSGIVAKLRKSEGDEKHYHPIHKKSTVSFLFKSHYNSSEGSGRVTKETVKREGSGLDDGFKNGDGDLDGMRPGTGWEHIGGFLPYLNPYKDDDEGPLLLDLNDKPKETKPKKVKEETTMDKIEKAQVVVEKRRRRLRERRALGLPPESLVVQPEVTIITDENYAYGRREKPQKEALSRDATVLTSVPGTGSRTAEGSIEKKHKSFLRIPTYMHSRAATDFITTRSRNISKAGLKWTVPKDEEVGPIGIGQKPMKRANTLTQLCRSSYPVTDALHKHGTSITKVQGKVLRSGDMRISKIWHRPVDQFVHPMQMANEDIAIS